MIDLFTIQASSSHATIVTVAFTMILAFLLSGVIALVYEWTFQGLSYSRNFVQSMILASIVVATVMQAIGDNVARGLGMMGALAIVRFRTNFKDSRDLMFLFAAISSGIACGVYSWGVALGGTAAFVVVALILYRTGFGNSRIFDGLLRFTMTAGEQTRPAIEALFNKELAQYALVSLREVAGGAGAVDCSYQIRLRRGKVAQALIAELSKVSGVSGIHLAMQDTTQEL